MQEERIKAFSEQLKQLPEIIENDSDISWKPKHIWFKANEWGYNDTKFAILKNMSTLLTGNKYTFSNKNMPGILGFCQKTGGVSFTKQNERTANLEHHIVPPTINRPFIDSMSNKISRISFENSERLMHSYGHTLQEMYMLKYGKFERYCDAVAYPKSTEQVIVNY